VEFVEGRHQYGHKEAVMSDPYDELDALMREAMGATPRGGRLPSTLALMSPLLRDSAASLASKVTRPAPADLAEWLSEALLQGYSRMRPS
jgi:hypothetical protein